MAADIDCWEPALGHHPDDPGFDEISEAMGRENLPPSPTLLKFLDALTARYPLGCEENDCIDIWSMHPEEGLTGGFLALSISWSGYEDAQPWIRQIAHDHGLHFFDRQTEEFYPASSK
jgi:hypothetical protein